MLAELDLRPGLRVLEIGAGSGYHAALMAEMVGRSELITTLDIDETLITETVDRLERLGYGAMTVRCVDGALGAPDQAPFDRIVATVGCSDLSSAWIEQLAPGGRMLVPLEHGHLHPRVLVEKGDEVAGRFTGYSGFIPMEGAQRGKWIWAEPPEPSRRKSTTVELPGKVRAAVTPGNSRRPNLTRGLWNFATYLALRDRRAAGTALVIGSSFAMVHDGQVVFGGADGQALMARLLEIAADWLGLGTPGLSRYTMTFSPLSLPSPGRIEDSRSGPWHIERVDHRQTVVLSPAG
jgi:protein-L-isoaspartate(D-aspartate) O-methyltransferase